MIDGQLHDEQTPIRFAVTESSGRSYRYEIGILEGGESAGPSIFDLHPRQDENTSTFNAVLVVPTGIGAEIGGHAGDAAPVARLLASVCDTLITHPNVVNASDLNEMPGNGLYVEGSLLSRFLMGAIGLRRVRSNRVLVIIDAHPNERFARATVNAVNAARATYGLRCPRVIVLDPPLPVRGEYTPSGRAAGTVEDLERVFEVLDTHRGEYDAVALSTLVDVDVPHERATSPRGARSSTRGAVVEAMLTHAISTVYNVPSAHAPMMESVEVANIDPRRRRPAHGGGGCVADVPPVCSQGAAHRAARCDRRRRDVPARHAHGERRVLPRHTRRLASACRPWPRLNKVYPS